jgi:hypothetical protein
MTDLLEIGYMPKAISRSRKPHARSAAVPKVSQERDPLLALRGLGKELWKELGGGEKFIHELRSNWYGKGRMLARSRGVKAPE